MEEKKRSAGAVLAALGKALCYLLLFLLCQALAAVVFLLAAFVGLSPAILVICAGCFGLAYQKIRKERPQ